MIPTFPWDIQNSTWLDAHCLVHFRFHFVSLYRIIDSPNGAHANFVNRQFWTTFKLLRNVLCWQGIIGDGLLSDMALNSLLNRYLLIGLGVNPDPLDAINKCKQIVATLPPIWLEEGLLKKELQRFAGYLSMLGKNSKSIGRPAMEDIVSLLRYLKFQEESDTIKRTRL